MASDATIEELKAQQLAILQEHVDALSTAERDQYEFVKQTITGAVALNGMLGLLALSVVCTESQGKPLGEPAE